MKTTMYYLRKAQLASVFVSSTFLWPASWCQQPGTKKWEFRTQGEVTSSPALGPDGTIYFGSWDRKLYAVLPNGVKRWEFQTNDRITDGPSVGSDGSIYFYSTDGTLYALSPTGRRKWEIRAQSADAWVHLAIAQSGTIYFNSNEGLLALSPDGVVKWRFDTGGWVHAASVASDGTVYVSHNNGHLYALTPSGGDNWKYRFKDEHIVTSSCSIDENGTIYFTITNPIPGFRDSPSGVLYAVRPDGSKVFELPSDQYYSPVIAKDGAMYATDGRELLVRNTNGVRRWASTLPGEPSDIPALADDGTVYVGTSIGVLFAIDENGREKWRFNAGDVIYSCPVISPDGTIYVGSNDMKLYAINGSGSLASSAWPMFRRDAEHRAAIPEPLPPAIRLSVHMYAGVSISGELGRRYRIDFANDVNANQWQPLSTITLDRTPYLYFDIESTNATRRFYRAIEVP